MCCLQFCQIFKCFFFLNFSGDYLLPVCLREHLNSLNCLVYLQISDFILKHVDPITLPYSVTGGTITPVKLPPLLVDNAESLVILTSEWMCNFLMLVITESHPVLILMVSSEGRDVHWALVVIEIISVKWLWPLPLLLLCESFSYSAHSTVQFFTLSIFKIIQNAQLTRLNKNTNYSSPVGDSEMFLYF